MAMTFEKLNEIKNNNRELVMVRRLVASKAEEMAKHTAYRKQILVCGGTGCTSSGSAKVIVDGRYAPIAGNICMDQCMVDVTDIPQAQVGEEVILIGTQGNETITAEEVALWADTISYEVLLGITTRVPRLYMNA